MKIGARRLLVVAVSACLAGAMASLPANAAGTGGHALPSLFGSHGGVAQSKSAKSPYLAGYQIDSGGNLYSVQVSNLATPAVSCSGSDSGVALGAGSEPAQGAPEYLGDVVTACFSGSPVYEIDALAPGGVENDNTDVAAGDAISITIVINCHPFPNCDIIIYVNDLTNGATVMSSGSGTLTASTVTFGSFPLFEGTQLAVPAFKTTSYAGCYLNGQAITGASAISEVSGKTVVLKPTKLKSGIDFGLTYE